MRTLSICGTRGRPAELRRMLDSFRATRRGDTDMLVYLSCDDPRLQDYAEILPDWCLWEIGAHKYYGEVMNYGATKCFPTTYDYYQEVNDDHVYITPGWDLLLSGVIEKNGGWGIAHPNKMGSPSDFSPSAYMTSGNIVRAVGWFTLPGLRQNSIDNAIHNFGSALGKYWYVPECVIEHRTWSASQRGYDLGVARDANADTVYSADEERHGSTISETWDYSADVQKVREAMRGK